MIAQAGPDIPGSPGCLPNASQRLLLEAACQPCDTAREAWRNWRAQHDLTAPDPVSARLLPWIYCRREMLQLSAADSAALEPGYRFVWMTNQRLLNSAALVVRTLRSEGIDVMLLKGLPLLIESYHDEGGRFMSDFDILVRDRDLRRAVASLASLGWQPHTPAALSDAAMHLRHSELFVHATAPFCDVHWCLLRPGFDSVTEAPLWAAKRTISIRDEEACVPSAEHMILHLFVHGMSWESIPPIRWILDVHLVLQRHAPNWQLILDEARRRGAMLPLAEAMALFDEILPGSIPSDALEYMARFRPTRKQRVAYGQIAKPYEAASWQVRWNVYAADYRQARGQGRLAPGFQGVIQHLCLYLRVSSPWRLPREFLRRLCNKVTGRGALR